MSTRDLLRRTAEIASDFLESLEERPVRPDATIEELRAILGGPLPEGPSSGLEVIEQLARDAGRGLMGMPSGRFFGFVLGGSFPTAVATDWLTSAWDQNAGLALPAPSAGVVEEVAGRWLKELFGLPEACSFGFVTGCQMAHFTCLAAARHHLLAELGWDVEREGLNGAPAIRVVAGANRHATVDRALRFLGMGTAAIDEVPADGEGRMLMDALRPKLACERGPTIVCVQAGEINTGAFDDFRAAADACAGSRAWLHIDGAF